VASSLGAGMNLVEAPSSVAAPSSFANATASPNLSGGEDPVAVVTELMSRDLGPEVDSLVQRSLYANEALRASR
jgi:hypothetical protein